MFDDKPLFADLKLNYSLLNFCGINLWRSTNQNLPFKFIDLYLNSYCISILPIDYQILNNNKQYKDIKNLCNKMLKVLELAPGKLSKIEFYYNQQPKILQDTKKLLTEKLLIYSPKIIIVFGDLEFLDHKLLELKQVCINYILHPNHLLSNIKDKVIAYNGLLKCKEQMIINS